MKTILVIEDEHDLAELMAFNLSAEGYRPFIVSDGASALRALKETLPDLVVLDLMLPGMNGTEICRIMKHNERTSRIPVVMVTAKGEEIDRVVGFEVGAEDYIVKPFSPREFLLRIRAVLRRAMPEPLSGVRKIGPILVDFERCQAKVDGQDVMLTTTEFKLLYNMLEGAGRVLSRDLLLQEVWGYNYPGETRTVDTHMTRLRMKLGSAGSLIKTVRGFGYMIEET